jgi:hypothetical protein
MKDVFMQRKTILELTLRRKYFAEVAAGIKKTEYREAKQYWKSRLEGRSCDVVRFRNGYTKNAPEVTVQFRGVRRQGKEYAIRLGKILNIKRWKRQS